jgi:hypothetical protein
MAISLCSNLTMALRSSIQQFLAGSCPIVSRILIRDNRKSTCLRTYVWAVAGISVACFGAAVIAQFTYYLSLYYYNRQILRDPGKDLSAGIVINIVIVVSDVLVDALLLVVPTLVLKDAQTTM